MTMTNILDGVWSMVSYVTSSQLFLALCGLVVCVILIKIINRIVRR